MAQADYFCVASVLGLVIAITPGCEGKMAGSTASERNGGGAGVSGSKGFDGFAGGVATLLGGTVGLGSVGGANASGSKGFDGSGGNLVATLGGYGGIMAIGGANASGSIGFDGLGGSVALTLGGNGGISAIGGANASGSKGFDGLGGSIALTLGGNAGASSPGGDSSRAGAGANSSSMGGSLHSTAGSPGTAGTNAIAGTGPCDGFVPAGGNTGTPQGGTGGVWCDWLNFPATAGAAGRTNDARPALCDSICAQQIRTACYAEPSGAVVSCVNSATCWSNCFSNYVRPRGRYSDKRLQCMARAVWSCGSGAAHGLIEPADCASADQCQ